MARKRKIGGIDTNTLLLIGGGAVAVYLLTRKPATVTPPTVITVPSGGGSGLSSAQYVSIGETLANALSNIFG